MLPVINGEESKGHLYLSSAASILLHWLPFIPRYRTLRLDQERIHVTKVLFITATKTRILKDKYFSEKLSAGVFTKNLSFKVTQFDVHLFNDQKFLHTSLL